MPVADDTLRSLRFRKEREESWRKLEGLLKKAEGGAASRLSDEQLVEIPALYRAALSSLSVARATSLDAALVEYLEALCARAYFFVYGARSTFLQRMGRFFARDWPLAVQRQWRETLASALLIVVATVMAYVLVMHDSDWFGAFVGSMAQGRTPDATVEELRRTIYGAPDDQERSWLSVFATFLFTHNASVSILSFALGFAFGVPAAFLLIMQGLQLGAMFAVFASHGLGLQFGGWIFIHGVTELSAIILSGAAGMRIGWAIAFPGAQSRLAAAEQAGREGGVVMIGVVVMLFIAGMLEGFARQLIVIDWVRWSIAGATALMWGLYFYLPRRREP